MLLHPIQAAISQYKTILLMCLASFVGLASFFIYQSLFAAHSPVGSVPEVDQWISTIEDIGGAKAYDYFAELNKDEPYPVQHDNAHLFGEALYKVEGIPGVAVCDSRFGFGCYHSFFGWALMENGLSIIHDLDEACIAAYGEKGLGCQHGIGHGVLAELGHDALGEALVACKELNWQGPIGGCTSGVLMEYNFGTMDLGNTRVATEDNLYEPCDSLDAERFGEACYFEQVSWWHVTSDEDPVFVGERCDELTDTRLREACFRGAGNTFAGRLEYGVDRIKDTCGAMPNREAELLCIEGAAWVVGSQPEYRDRWQELCEAFTGKEMNRCFASKDII